MNCFSQMDIDKTSNVPINSRSRFSSWGGERRYVSFLTYQVQFPPHGSSPNKLPHYAIYIYGWFLGTHTKSYKQCLMKYTDSNSNSKLVVKLSNTYIWLYIFIAVKETMNRFSNVLYPVLFSSAWTVVAAIIVVGVSVIPLFVTI